MTPEQSAFVLYITNTLIPDLEESGMEATASDFDRLAAIVHEQTKCIDLLTRKIDRMGEAIANDDMDSVEIVSRIADWVSDCNDILDK